jgi:hypothetical protein
MRKIAVIMTLLLPAVLVTACSRGSDEFAGEVSPPVLAPGENFMTVGNILRENNLRTVPEVLEESERHLAMFHSGDKTPEEAATLFRAWLEKWMAENPERVAKARAENPDVAPLTRMPEPGTQ